jgi:autophagy-related protein 33
MQQGLSYTLSTLTLPTLLTLPSATSASRAFTNLTTLSLTHLRALAGISSSSFLLAYLLSPRSQKHPYLLWTTLFVASSGLTDLILRPTPTKPITSARTARQKDKKGKGRQMDASYEVLGTSDRESDGTMSGEEAEVDINGEEVRDQMEGFVVSQIMRTAIAGIGFAMSIVGIWGDGSSDVVIIEM